MIKRLLLMVGGTAFLWLLVAYPAYRLDPEHGLLHSCTAALLCVIPTAATLLWCDLVVASSPEQQMMAVLGSTAVRIAFVAGAGVVLYKTIAEFEKGRFWLWVIGFYLATLTLEMVLVVRRQAAMDKASSANPPPV